MTTTLDSAARLVRAAVFDDIDRIYDAQQANRARIAATTAAERIGKLRRLERALFAHRDEDRKSVV